MKIAIIAPIQGIIDTVHKMMEKDGLSADSEIEVVLGDWDTGLQQAYLAIERGADVIISRGGTASLIARHVGIPVVEIQVSALDILRAIKLTGDETGTVGAVFTRRLLFKCDRLGELIG